MIPWPWLIVAAWFGALCGALIICLVAVNAPYPRPNE